MTDATVGQAWESFVDALGRTRLPKVDAAQLADATLGSHKIRTMLAELATHWHWEVRENMRQLDRHRPEDMLWLWCMHSLWKAPDCRTLLDNICRPGWPKKTHGERFSHLSRYGAWRTKQQVHKRGQPDIACYLGPPTHLSHAFWCELAFIDGTPRERHKDCEKIRSAPTPPQLVVWHVLIEGTLCTEAEPSQRRFELPPSHRVARLVITPEGQGQERGRMGRRGW